jgi:DNA-binding response OmpR family regulator
MVAAYPLAGLRVLVVEDETLVSLLIEDFLLDQMCLVVGPHYRVQTAFDEVRNASIDFALLDVNVAGTKVYPVAEVLHARGIPFLFLSGYGPEAVPACRPEWQVCSKPFSPDVLATMMFNELTRTS